MIVVFPVRSVGNIFIDAHGDVVSNEYIAYQANKYADLLVFLHDIKDEFQPEQSPLARFSKMKGGA